MMHADVMIETLPLHGLAAMRATHAFVAFHCTVLIARTQIHHTAELFRHSPYSRFYAFPFHVPDPYRQDCMNIEKHISACRNSVKEH